MVTLRNCALFVMIWLLPVQRSDCIIAMCRVLVNNSILESVMLDGRCGRWCLPPHQDVCLALWLG